MVCKTWNGMALKYLNGLCTNRLFPDAETVSCPICITPIRELSPCSTFCSPALSAYRYILLDIRTSLVEPSHVYPVETWSSPPSASPPNIRVYDQYPEASEMGEVCTLEATGWSAGVNTTCTWQFQNLYRRWYQRITTGGSDQTMAVSDLPYSLLTPPSNPFAGCSPGSTNQCGFTDWGHRWTLQVVSTSLARLTLNRFTARHFAGKDPFTEEWKYWQMMDSDPVHDLFSISNGWPYPLTPSIPAGFGFASSPGSMSMGIWEVADPCTKSGSWIFEKTMDAADSAPIGDRIWMVPTNLPQKIKITVRAD